MSKVDVKETITSMPVNTSFIKNQGVDIRAAFQRMTITQDMLKNYCDAINATNTVDVGGELREFYNHLDVIAKAIIRKELELITLNSYQV